MSRKNKEYKERAKNLLENHVDIKCKCGAVGTWHACPYSQEFNNDSIDMCTCCKECTKRCALDI